MVSNSRSIVRSYTNLRSFFSRKNQCNTSFVRLSDSAKIFIGCAFLSLPINKLADFFSIRYFLDAIGVSELPEGETINIPQTIVEVRDFMANEGLLKNKDEINDIDWTAVLLQFDPQIENRDLECSTWGAERRQSFEENGYIVIPDFFSRKYCDELRREIYFIADNEREENRAYHYGKKNLGQRIYNLISKTRSFDDMLLDSRLNNILSDIFYRDTFHPLYSMSSWHANILAPGAERQIWHVDASVPNPLPPWIVRCNVSFVIEEHNEENGATRCVPGSHKWCRKPDRYERTEVLKGVKTLNAPKGSIIIWHGHLWHQSGENLSRQNRVALLACYAASYLLEVALEENHSAIIGDGERLKMDDRLQELFALNHGRKDDKVRIE